MSGTLGKLAARSPPSSQIFLPDGGSQRGQVSVLALLSPHSARVSDLVGTSPGLSSTQRPSTLQKGGKVASHPAGSSRGPSPSPLASAPGGSEEATQETSPDRPGPTWEEGGKSRFERVLLGVLSFNTSPTRSTFITRSASFPFLGQTLTHAPMITFPKYQTQSTTGHIY